jgi:outer membrane protein TolC
LNGLQRKQRRGGEVPMVKDCWWVVIAVLLILHGVQAGGQVVAAEQSAAAGAPIVITLDEAIHRAQVNDPAYASAVADQRSAALDRSIALAALLPNVIYHNQYLYTQPNGAINAAERPGLQQTPKFIAANAVREYMSQGSVNEVVGLDQVAAYRRAGALSVQSQAEREIARRGLIVSVVNAYYTLLAADQRLKVAGRSAIETQDFHLLSQQLEHGGEVAHADVVKATLQQQQRERDLADATLAAQKARLDLGVLLFADPRTPYTLADDTATPPAPPLRAEVDAAAAKNNPELRSALAAVHAADEDVTLSRAGYLPSLGLNYTYGIDAPQFATNGSVGIRNLGYSASATLDIPVWDWLATRDRVKQSELRRNAAKTALSFAQRRLLAQLEELYAETSTASNALTSLQASVETARESLRLTKLRYSAGEGSVLDVVDAQNALTAAENADADGTVRYRLALANLQTLTGNMP